MESIDALEWDVPSDTTISRTAEKRPVQDVAADLSLAPDDIEPFGAHAAKLTHESLRRLSSQRQDGRLILVTAMTPTPRGEGKTVTTIGLGGALQAIGERSLVAIREPSLGPIFGFKGGATGGGYAQVVPMENINLQFTGDFPAITAAHNLVAAMLDNRVHRDDSFAVEEIVWPRTLDVNDRTLRNVVVGRGGSVNGVERESSFVITAASELMAVVGMATDLEDLERRVARVIVAYDSEGEPVTIGDLEATGAVVTLLRNALRPNLVQTLDGTPAFVHGGPFANIAHGTNTVLADQVGLSLADYVVTEAGFGSDLGAEKFFDIVSRQGVTPDAVVLVATVRALKHHGSDGASVDGPDVEAVRAGFPNLDHHIESIRAFGLEPVVAINRFQDDTEAELATVLEHCRAVGCEAAVFEGYYHGAEGGTALARLVRDAADVGAPDFEPLYDLETPLEAKIETVATRVYGADGVEFTDEAERDLERLRRHGFDDLPVCLSKVPSSLSDDSNQLGVPADWTLTVRELYPAAGPGFVVALTGNVLTMPGLPKTPSATELTVDEDGNVDGL